MTKVVNYVSEAFTELKVNVTWLPWAEVQRLTIIVAVFSVVFSLVIWGIDEVFSTFITQLFKIIKA
jgi:preprotein translocase subunit SecE